MSCSAAKLFRGTVYLQPVISTIKPVIKISYLLCTSSYFFTSLGMLIAIFKHDSITSYPCFRTSDHKYKYLVCL